MDSCSPAVRRNNGPGASRTTNGAWLSQPQRFGRWMVQKYIGYMLLWPLRLRQPRLSSGLGRAAIHPIGINVVNAYFGKGKSYVQL
jgi:hypothetical protein